MISRSFIPLIRTLLQALVETALPAACPACGWPLGEHRAGVCLSCWQEIRETPCVARALPGRALTSVTSLGPYEGRLRRIIRCLKFSDLPGLAAPLGERLSGRLSEMVDEVDLIVPVPLHRGRRLRRGYNQAELIAAQLARSLTKPMAASALSRRRPTASQTGQSQRERTANVRGAFVAKGRDLKGKSVLLVDDVVTTGATVRECARVLKAAGARAVHVAAPARTLSRIES